MSAKDGRDDAADAEVEQRPGRMLAARAAAEILARDEDLRPCDRPACSARSRRLLAGGIVADLVEQVLAEPGPLDRLQELLRDDLVGVDVDLRERGGDAGQRRELLHGRGPKCWFAAWFNPIRSHRKAHIGPYRHTGSTPTPRAIKIACGGHTAAANPARRHREAHRSQYPLDHGRFGHADLLDGLRGVRTGGSVALHVRRDARGAAGPDRRATIGAFWSRSSA